MSGLAVDAEGYLVDPGDWNEDWARYAAMGEKINLTPEHWTVLNSCAPIWMSITCRRTRDLSSAA